MNIVLSMFASVERYPHVRERRSVVVFHFRASEFEAEILGSRLVPAYVICVVDERRTVRDGRMGP